MARRSRQRMSTPGGQVNSRKNASRQGWLADIKAKAKGPIRESFVKYDERPGGMERKKLERWMLDNNIGFVKQKGGYLVQQLYKAKAA